MQFLLDHISSFIVFSAVMLIVALLQLRGMQSNAESVVNYMVRTGTLDISEMLERDLLNMRTEQQTLNAIGDNVFPGNTGVFQCDMTASGDTTMSFTFPTLKNPQLDITNPDTATVAQVLYQLTPDPGFSVSRLIEGDTLVHQLYHLDRFVTGEANGWSDRGIAFFRIELAEKGNPAFLSATGACPPALSRVRFQIQMTQRGFEEITDQESRTQLNFSRFGSTVDLSNWD